MSASVIARVELEAIPFPRQQEIASPLHGSQGQSGWLAFLIKE